MFTSKDWETCKWSNSVKGKTAYSTVMSLSFWKGVNLCFRVFAPLVKVLRLVDGDQRTSMAFVYGELKQAKEEMREVLKNNENIYRPIFEIIDEKSKNRLDTPLHLTAYILNLFYYFNDHSIYDKVVSIGVCNFVEVFYPDNLEMQNLLVNMEFRSLK
ncbi:hypothetical protein Dsin_002059 [Dipteronia sinensis]|uniref:Uncharacterized protein n=1 Tax=Dipteronia sinensis TaxID=43782 RepID=A0AAE0B5Y1_9ROSI|nr:hypothetical protein Dsin_002059 [Dipteronia sinensis]